MQAEMFEVKFFSNTTIWEIRQRLATDAGIPKVGRGGRREGRRERKREGRRREERRDREAEGRVPPCSVCVCVL